MKFQEEEEIDANYTFLNFNVTVFEDDKKESIYELIGAS